MSRTVFLLLGCLAFGLVNSERVRYDNYRVYKVEPHSDADLSILRELDGTSDSLKFLDPIEIPNKDVHIVVSPHKEPDFVQILKENGVTFKLVEENLQRHLDEEIAITPRAGMKYDWTRYHTLEETYAWLKDMSKKFSVVELLVGGKTYEGREILGVKISYGPGRKGIFVEGGIHAREWIAPATVTYIVNQLLTSKDPAVREIAEGYDWYIFPHANPDGYVYTHNTNRLWRKTRARYGMCFGADPNRNWDFFWMSIGASNNPCSDTFAGTAPFSEIETRTLSEYIASLKGKIQTYLSFHAYSQLLLFPYGHTKEHAPNHNDMQRIGNEAAKALAKRYGTQYIVGNIYETIYPASGASIEWAYGKLNVPLVYTYELRPRNQWNGFILPPQQIVPVGEETMDSVVALLREAKKLGYYK
uniref:Zinc carboxypeptidase A 1 n=1 Tax=Dolopus genitalis TaxID=2488630 RepID=A0A3G5BIF5_DOLGE|nr:venom polypeptide [Dolopus genitalis]